MRRIRDVADRLGMPREPTAPVGPREASLAHVYADREGVRFSVGLWPLDVDGELRRLGLPTPADLSTPTPTTDEDRAFLSSTYRLSLAAARRQNALVLSCAYEYVTKYATKDPAKIPTAGYWAVAQLRLWQVTGRYLLCRLAQHDLPLAEPGMGMTLTSPLTTDADPPYSRALLEHLWNAVYENLTARGEPGLLAYLDPAPEPVVPAAGANVPTFAAIADAFVPFPEAERELATDILAAVLGYGPAPFVWPGTVWPTLDGMPPATVTPGSPLPSARDAARAHKQLDAIAKRAQSHGLRIKTRRQAVREAILGRFVIEHAEAAGYTPALRAAVLGDISCMDDRVAAAAWGAETAERSGGVGGWIFVQQAPEGDDEPVPQIPNLPELPDLVFHTLARFLLHAAIHYREQGEQIVATSQRTSNIDEDDEDDIAGGEDAYEGDEALVDES